jgi:hypothetical protein
VAGNRDVAGSILHHTVAADGGRFVWSDFELCVLPNGTYAMGVQCDWPSASVVSHTLYLAPCGTDPAGRLLVRGTPYGWSTAVEAFAARDRYAVQTVAVPSGVAPDERGGAV